MGLVCRALMQFLGRFVGGKFEGAGTYVYANGEAVEVRGILLILWKDARFH